MSLFDDVPSLSPVLFFEILSFSLYARGALKPEKEYLLPSTAELLAEEPFADVYAGWNVDKISFYLIVHVPFQKVPEADLRRGDSFEVFIDTRDLKTKGVVSRFCHHFVFFPVEVQNFFGREVTRFRNEDTHRLCHPEDLIVSPDIGGQSYSLLVVIPAQ